MVGKLFFRIQIVYVALFEYVTLVYMAQTQLYFVPSLYY